MTKLTGLCVCVMLALTTIGRASQAPQDFSGSWTIESSPAPVLMAATAATAAATAQTAAPRGDMGSGWGTTLTIAQDASRLRLEYAAYSRYDVQPPFVFLYALDGSETRNTVMAGRGTQIEASKATWQGQALMITTSVNANDPISGKPFRYEVTRKISLESPTAMIVEVTRPGALGGPSSTTRTVYKKS